MQTFQWEKLNDKNRQSLSSLRPIFILGSRTISKDRIQQLTKKLGGKRPVLWGCLLDEYIPGLEKSAQFRSLKLEKLESVLNEVNLDSNQVNVLRYRHRYLKYILREISLSAVIGIYGSWHKAFHFTNAYFEITQKKIPYRLVSSFVDEAAAKKYGQKLEKKYSITNKPDGKLTDEELMNLAKKTSKQSCDYTFQTGAILTRDHQVLATAYNRVIPYKTYSLHHGASKEKHFSPPQDLNHFDTNHAEVELLLKATQEKINLKETSLYINLLPCPTCAKMIAASLIKEVVYQHDYSQGYAFDLLTKTGKVVRRVS